MPMVAGLPKVRKDLGAGFYLLASRGRLAVRALYLLTSSLPEFYHGLTSFYYPWVFAQETECPSAKRLPCTVGGGKSEGTSRRLHFSQVPCGLRLFSQMTPR